MKKRSIAFFCVYDSEGIIDEYVIYILRELEKIAERIVVIVNGYIQNEYYKALEKVADTILIRKNKGFDAGAYKYALMKEDMEQLVKYEEVIFCNDTFFGPFVSFETIFNTMRERNADFWGLYCNKNNVANHIQSYFLVFNRKQNCINSMIEYMIENISENELDLREVYARFEVGLFNYLVDCGFQYDTYALESENIYSIYKAEDILLIENKLPIMKKKCFEDVYRNEQAIQNVLCYLSRNSDYDWKLIQKYVRRKYDYNLKAKNKQINIIKRKEVKFPVSKLDYKEIVEYVNKAQKLYIYGAGIWARKVYFLYHKHFKCFKGFVVSEEDRVRELYGYPIIPLSKIEEDADIIVALNYQNEEEIYSKLVGDYNVLFLWHDNFWENKYEQDFLDLNKTE